MLASTTEQLFREEKMGICQKMVVTVDLETISSDGLNKLFWRNGALLALSLQKTPATHPTWAKRPLPFF